ncbi:MAG: winged helix-turn-helix transcriptional regulator [Pseudomonadales bacterium]|nr:metalloregulator ArsR/SmtB family transcription factor [Gammaproteobacteria bacterium]NNL56569.1 winged helix-turn-helix transcriptional regulator [Pseudomonadales bacterium]
MPTTSSPTTAKAGAINAADLAALAENAGRAAELMRLMSNQNRLMILCSLIDGELSVGELNDCIPLSQSALSQHLANLRQADLVNTRREAQNIYYRLKGEAPIKVISVLKELFCPDHPAP